MNLQLAGKKALITGGSQGVGKEVARFISEAGVDCVICSADGAKLTETARELVRFTGSLLSPVPGSKIYPVQADLRDSESISNLVKKAAQLLGGIDILVNSGSDSIESTVEGHSHLIQAVGPYMKENNWGRIITVSGYTDEVSNEEVLQLAKSSTAKLGQHGITVNVVDRGVTETETAFVSSQDIAHVVTFLASPLSAAITGNVIDVSGGSSKTLHYQK